jgi:nucleoside 2-deoxyribosyltransferase
MPAPPALGVYLAGPDGFTPAGLAWHLSTLIPAVEAAGMVPLSPWSNLADEFETVAAIADDAQRIEAYRDLNRRAGAANAAMIDQSAGVLAVLDGTDVDSGAASEIGYAAGTGKVIVGLRTDFRRTGDNEGSIVNLQVQYFVEQSGGRIFRTLAEAIAALASLVDAPMGPARAIEAPS